jgi:hypothetical protein
MGSRLRLLKILLRIGGVATICAFATILLPVDWMAATHARLGLGAFPRAPVVDYLARSIAALYGFHGVLLLLIARDPVKYASIVTYVAVLNVVFGLMLIGIDLHAGMPMWWTAGEGPPIIAFGIVVALLNRSLD